MSPRERRLCEEYIKDLSASGAAKRAGYAKSSWPYAVRNAKRKPEWMELFHTLMGQMREQAVATGSEVLAELSRIGRANMLDLFNEDGSEIPPHQLPRDVAAAIEEFSYHRTENGEHRYKYRFANKRGALELLGKYHRLWSERITLGGDEEAGPVRVVLAEEYVAPTEDGEQ